jgi:hypothetical protein
MTMLPTRHFNSRIAGCLVLLGAVPLLQAASASVALTTNSAAEQQTRDQLERILGEHKLDPFLFQKHIVIDERTVSHSSPVFTLGTANGTNDVWLISDLLHQEMHVYVAKHRGADNKTIAVVKAAFPNLPSDRPDGAGDPILTDEEVIVVHLEYTALRRVVGDDKAREAFQHWTEGTHNRAVYRLILDHDDQVGEICARQKLTL